MGGREVNVTGGLEQILLPPNKIAVLVDQKDSINL